MVDALLVPHEVLLEGVPILKYLQTINAQEMPRVLVIQPEMRVHLCVDGGAVRTHLAHVGHFPRFMGVFHVLQEERLTVKRPFTNLTLRCGLVGAVHVLQVALQLEWGGELPITVLACGVPVHLSILLVQLHMVLHVIHEPDVILQPLGTVHTAEGGGHFRQPLHLVRLTNVPSIIEVIYKHDELALRCIICRVLGLGRCGHWATWRGFVWSDLVGRLRIRLSLLGEVH